MINVYLCTSSEIRKIQGSIIEPWAFGLFYIFTILQMSILNQLKFLALWALTILAIAYFSSSFDIQTRAFICMAIMFICAEIQSKQK